MQPCAGSKDRVSGNQYFPEHALKREYVTLSNHKTTCPWKGEALHYSPPVNDDMLPDAVWFYPEPNPEAHLIQRRVAFWKGVVVKE